jgi:hypothetical protein
MTSIIFYIFIALLTIFIISYTSYILYLQLIPGAFYYPSQEKSIQTMIKLASSKPNDIFIDLGSGDGCAIIAAAKMGLKSIGYKLNPLLVRKSRKKIEKLKLSHLATIELKNFWKIDFQKADIVYIYQFPKYINKLEKIFQKTNHPLTIISNQYPFPHQKPFLTKDKLYFYKFP